jgi:hypothetical protein
MKAWTGIYGFLKGEAVLLPRRAVSIAPVVFEAGVHGSYVMLAQRPPRAVTHPFHLQGFAQVLAFPPLQGFAQAFIGGI